MPQTKTSTRNVNRNSIALLSPIALTSEVNFMEMQEGTPFGKWLKPLIEQLKPISQAQVAKRAGITSVQLSRIVTGVSGVKRETASNIIDAINELGGREIGNKTEGLRLAGFTPQNQDEVQIIANRLAQGVLASGFNDLEDEGLREIFLEDMRTIAESMLKRRLEEQERQRKIENKKAKAGK